MLKSNYSIVNVINTLLIVNDAMFGPDSSNSKLEMAGLLLLQLVIKQGKKEALNFVGEKIMGNLMHIINDGNGKETLRAKCFETVGMLVNRLPNLILSNPQLIHTFYSSFSSEGKNTSVHVQDALCSMMPACQLLLQNDAKNEELIFGIILENLESVNSFARYTAARYLNGIFPYSHSKSRFLNIVCVADEKLEISEQGYLGLEFPQVSHNDADIEELVACLESVGSKLTNKHRRGKIDLICNLPVKSYTILLRYLRQLLIRKCCGGENLCSLRDEWDTKTESLVVDERIKFKKSLQQWPFEGVVQVLQCCKMVLESKQGTGVVQSVSARILLELLSMGPTALAHDMAQEIDWYYPFLISPKVETRFAVSRLVGILAAQRADCAKRVGELEQEIAKTQELEKKHGYILAASYIISRFAFHSPSKFSIEFENAQLNLILTHIYTLLQHQSADMIIAAATCFGEIGRNVELKSQELPSNCVEKLYSIIKTTKEIKVQEACIASIGHYLVGNPLELYLDQLIDLPKILPTQVELYFSIGEAICGAVFGYSSTSLEEYNDVPETSISNKLLGPLNAEVVDKYVAKVLAILNPTQSPINRKAASIWVLCIVKYCAKHQLVNKSLKNFHDAFSSILGDKDEFTQEIASKGIGLIYESADAGLKKELVEGLVSTFSVGKKIAAQSITRDTQLFSNNALGSTPEGNDITTYQSILSLAADMNQPDLVYKFMNLASHHAIWNSKRGASMGFASIASQAEAELSQYLPSIVPRLYRYQFDPHPKTALGMKSIWKSLVKDQKIVDTLFNEIMKEVVKGMTDSMWRTREASSSALADLVRGRKLEQLEPFMGEMWTLTFRCLDDIKQSVRTATLQTAKSLGNITIRFCDPLYYEPSRSHGLMAQMVPLLLKQGLLSSTPEVQQFALATILKLCKTSGVLLKPHVVDIICTLLESLSSLESQSLNYLSFHAESYSISQNDLDSSRLAAAKSSPTMEAIQECVPQLDSTMMEAFVPRFCNIIKKGVGLPTRAGCARLVYILVLKVSTDIQPHADAILKALSVAIEDSNATIRKSFSTALGYLIKLCTEDGVQKFALKLKEKYLAASTDEQRSVAPVTFLEISRNSQTVANELHSTILPLAFLGARDTNQPALAEIWTKVWDENTGGTTNAIRSWKNELIQDCQIILQASPSWTMKKQVGKALADISKTLQKDIVPSLPIILPLLSEALKGRTWEGKESVLEAFAYSCSEGCDYFENEIEAKKNAEDIMIRESQKSNPLYKRHAIEYLGQVFEAFKSDRYSEIVDSLIAVAKSADDEMDVDEDIQKPLRTALQASSFKALAMAFPFQPLLQGISILNRRIR